MRFMILGPIEVEDRGEPIPLGGRKQRLVLAHLIRRPNEVVSTNVLIDDVWGDAPPEAARSTLQSYVYRLRTAIGPDRLDGPHGGYRIRVEPGELDAREFELLALKGREELDRDPAACVDDLRNALGLWRGPAFGELSDELSLQGEIARLEEARRLAMEDRLAAELDLGQDASLVGELEAQTLEDPLRERPWALWMLALYRSGRQADALAAFRTAQTIFADQLGIDPGRSLQQLHERILAQDPSLLTTAHDAAPILLTTEAAPALNIFLIADIRGYTTFTHVKGDEAAAALSTRFAELTDQVVGDAGGSLVELRGDEALVAFTSARQAIRAATDLQSRFVEETVRDPSLPLAVGIGLDAGEAVAVEGGFRGGALNLAARLCSVAGPGEILSTREVVHLARRVDGVTQIDRGSATFKGLSEPVGVIELRREGWDPALDLAFQRALGPGAQRPTAASAGLAVANPYKGLLPFEESDAGAFFGREALTQELISRLATDRFLAVVGPSGSGKSSVVRAGLMPALRAGALPGSERWSIVEMLPGPHPMIELETALLRIVPDPSVAVGLLEVLEHDELGMLRAIKRILPPGSDEIVVFVDQLEEVFTLGEDEARRARFLAGIRALVADPHARVRVVTTLRADFFDRPLSYPGFADLMRSSIEAVVPLTADEIERAIVEPARRVGVELERGLLAAMLAETADEPGALPLLQYALTELFQRREGTTMTLDAYRTIGGVAGALSGRAEELYMGSTDTERTAARQLFLRLLTPGEGTEDVRRRVTRTEITSVDVDRNAMNRVVDRFGSSRLLSFDRDARSHQPTVEVAHEALLRSWPRLRGWVEGAREDVRMSRRLHIAAMEWIDAEREPSFLLRGGQLAQFESWAIHSSVVPTAEERSFLDASVDARAAEEAAEEARVTREIATERRSVRRLRVVVAVITAAALIGGLLTIVAVRERNQAERATRNATARELAGAALSTVDVDPDLSILLALRAVEATHSVDGSVVREAEEALHVAVGSSRLLRTLRDPSSGTVSVSPDGSRIATAQRLAPATGTVIEPVIWDAATGERVLKLSGGHAGNVNDIQFNPDGSLVATAGEDGAVVIWDATTGGIVRSIRADDAGELGGAFNLDFSPDGSRVVVTTLPGDEATIGMFAVDTGERLFAIPLPYTVCGIDFSPDGSLIIGGECFTGGFPTAHLWDATSGAEVRPLGDHGGTWVIWAAFSPDGTLAVTLGLDGIGRVWNVRTGHELVTLAGHAEMQTADFSPDGDLVATSGADGTAKVWDVRSGRQRLTLSVPGGAVGEVKFSPDGATLITGGAGATRVWDVTPEGRGEALAIATRIVTVYPQVAYGLRGSVLVSTDEGGVTVWDATSGDRLERFPWRSDLTGFVHDDQRVLVSTDPPVIEVDDTGEMRATYPTLNPNTVAYSPDGSMLASGHQDGRVLLWDAETGVQIATLNPASDRLPSVNDLAFSPDGSLLVWASSDGTAKVWDLRADRVIRTFTHASSVNGVAFSPDGSMVATGFRDGAKIWQLDGDRAIVLAGHQGAVMSVRFSPDGTRVVTSSQDQTIRLWDVETGREVLILRGHTAPVSDIAFSPDGVHLASASYDGTIREYVLPIDALIELAKSRLTRTWTQEECRQYLRLETCPAA
jgi:WD40 repeat protein/DNA-binding SARP family transcriptional activator